MARVLGVSRMADNQNAILVSLDRPLSNHELVAFHEFLRDVRIYPNVEVSREPKQEEV